MHNSYSWAVCWLQISWLKHCILTLLWVSLVPAHVIRRHLITGNVLCRYKLWSFLLCHFLRPCIASCHAAPHVRLNNKAELITPCVRCPLLYYFYDSSLEMCSDIYPVKKFFIVLENGRFSSCLKPDICNFPDLVQASPTPLPYILSHDRSVASSKASSPRGEI